MKKKTVIRELNELGTIQYGKDALPSIPNYAYSTQENEKTYEYTGHRKDYIFCKYWQRKPRLSRRIYLNPKIDIQFAYYPY